MALLTRRIWNFLTPDGYITKQDRMQLAVGYNRSPTLTISSLYDTLVNVILGFLGGSPTKGIPDVVNAPYEEFKREDFFLIPTIHIIKGRILPRVKAKFINTIDIIVEYMGSEEK